MDRLTHRDNSGEAYTQAVDDMNVYTEPQFRYNERGIPVLENLVKEMRGSVVDRLARYEDLGLLPEELDELLHSTAGPLHRKLGLWIDADKTSNLRILPCKPGDMVWRICGQRGKKHVAQRQVESIEYTVSGEIWIHSTACDVFGKTVFLTREEAEAELERRKHE